ncbi:MAG: rRNA pseudouridine synthase [Oscillospiraceae bacterium]|nr:rRNA pseudouridine synthase [Oscillospiraceae bacterium]
MAERLQKIMAQAGLCSRRSAEDLLRQGRVSVNGRPASLGDRADPTTDRIEVDGRPLPAPDAPICLMLNKPRGYVTTLSDELGRPTAAQLVADCGRRVYPVGRLDRDSEGLLLFTNDGDLAQALLHPRHEVDKVYRVWVSGQISDAPERLASVTELEGEPIRPARVEEISRDGEGALLQVTIHQGKNRQIRRMCAQVGLSVRRLQRIREGKLALGDLKTGKWRYLTDVEIKLLKGNH